MNSDHYPDLIYSNQVCSLADAVTTGSALFAVFTETKLLLQIAGSIAFC